MNYQTLFKAFIGCNIILISTNLISCQFPQKTEKQKYTRDSYKQKNGTEEVGLRKRVLVLPFSDTSAARPQSLRDEAREDFMRRLSHSPDVIAVSSEDLQTDLSKLKTGNEYNMTELAKQASGLGVSAILDGTILDVRVKRKSDEVGVFRQMKTSFETKVKIRIFAARSGQEIFNNTKTMTIEEGNVRVAETVDSDRFLSANPDVLRNLVKEAFLEFTPQIEDALSKLSWEGRIALISGERLFLNVGRISGVQIGDILKVNDEGDEVYDPQTGNFIGKVQGKLKGTLEVVGYFGQDGAVAVIHSGNGFKESDRVELY